MKYPYVVRKTNSAWEAWLPATNLVAYGSTKEKAVESLVLLFKSTMRRKSFEYGEIEI